MNEIGRDRSKVKFGSIVQNGTINIRSVFLFDGGPTELFAFLNECREANCTVVFLNEGIKLEPGWNTGNPDLLVLMSTYATLAGAKEIQRQFLRFDRQESLLKFMEETHQFKARPGSE